MSTSKVSIWAVGALAAGLAASAPVFAETHGGGHTGGGAHFSGAHVGGAHASASAHFAPHAAVGGFHGAYTAGHVYSNGFHGAAVSRVDWHGGAGVHAFARPGGFVGRPAFGYGYGRAGFGYGRPFWGGGWWHGGFWPRAYYWYGYPWFLPVLPAIYATYWWGGVPYYYADNLYYTWNPGYNGYVVTDPPPAQADSSADGSGAPPAGYSEAAPPSAGYNGAPPPAGYNGAQPNTGNDMYVYPKNGQSDEQMAQDKYECHKWAVAQSGFDPTRGAQNSGDPTQYRRAMSACLDGRGYSAR